MPKHPVPQISAFRPADRVRGEHQQVSGISENDGLSIVATDSRALSESPARDLSLPLHLVQPADWYFDDIGRFLNCEQPKPIADGW